MAHTPGPWKIYRTTNGRAILGIGDKDAGGITDAEFGFWRSGAEYEANARLIAAAPELLEALKAVRDDFGDNCTAERGDEIRAMIAAAITKAEAE